MFTLVKVLAFAFLLSIVSGGHAQRPRQRCDGPEFRQFDFWLGEWTVTQADGRQAGTNRITAIEDGCALLEQWQGGGGSTGTSLNFYDRNDRKWHQAWMSNSGGALLLAGEFQDRRMVLRSESTGADGMMHRITWSPLGDGRVRQFWESSNDGGRSWKTAFDGTYTKRP